MSTSKISWEIVLAGIAFIGIGIYLINNNSQSEASSSSAAVWNSQSRAPHPSPDSNLPGAIVIDLDNLESLEKLKELHNIKQLENLKDLEIELKNLDKVIEKHAQQGVVKESLEKSLQQLEKELQKIDEADFRVKLQDQKIYINKNYNIDEAKWTEVKAGEYVFRETFEASDLKSMDLQLNFGNLNIVGGDANEQGEIILRATGNVEGPATFTNQMNIYKQLNGPDAVFRIQPADDSNISDQINLEATLTVPQNLQLSANTSGGHINASNMVNDKNLKTSGGHITLSSLEGKTVAKTNGGHITGDEISGNISVSTGGGHIQINQSDGSLSAKTGGGHIEIQDASGSITAKTSGGNISASMHEVNGDLKFTTSAGNVTLSLPQNIAADLELSGSSVNISEDFNFDGTKNRSSISGSINGGGLSVVVNCGYGNISINSN